MENFWKWWIVNQSFLECFRNSVTTRNASIKPPKRWLFAIIIKNTMANEKPYKLLDKDIQERLLQAIRLGAYIEHACYYAGIRSSTFREWRQKASENIEPYASFWIRVNEAESEAIMRRLARIEQAGKDGSWQADAWYLERKYPDKFGRKEKLELSSDPNAPVEIELNWSDGNKLERQDEIVIDNAEVVDLEEE